MSWKKEDVGEWFSDRKVAGKWNRLYEFETEVPEEHFFRLRRDHALHFVENHVPRGGRILDFGCGAGPVLTALLERGYDCVGVDYSEDMLHHAQRRLRESSIQHTVLVRGDCSCAPLPGASFDCVVCLGVISYVEDFQPILLEINRLLKPGGMALISFRNQFNPLLSDPVVSAKWIIKKTLGRASEQPHHLGRFLDPKKVRDEATAAGLVVLGVEGIGFGPFALNGRTILSGRTNIRISDHMTRWMTRFNLKPALSWLTDINILVATRG